MRRIDELPIDIIILSGLPGSGKTTFAKKEIEQYKYSNTKILHVEVDNFMSKGNIYDALRASIRHMFFTREVYGRNIKREVAIIDGLFLTNKDVIDAIKIIYEEFEIRGYRLGRKTIEYWEENREVCLINDKGRREQSSELTIRKAYCEKISKEELQKYDEDGKFNVPNILIVKHYVTQKLDWKINVAEYTCPSKENEEELRSFTWTTGGSCRSYDSDWNDKYESITPDEVPEDFEEFDELLEKIAPKLTFLEYKKLKKECVHIENGEDDDYYSHTYFSYWVCHLPTLYDMLVEMGYIS